MAAVLEQRHHRFAPQTAWARSIVLWAAGEDAAVANWPKSLPFYLLVQLYNSGDAAASIQPGLEWRESGGSWGAVTTNSAEPVYVRDNGWYRAEISTTIKQLSGTGIWVNGKIVTGSDRVGVAYSLGAGQLTECCWSLCFGAGATKGSTYELRVTNAGTVLDTYSATPQQTCANWTVEVVSAGADSEGWYDGSAWDHTSGQIAAGDTDVKDAYWRFALPSSVLPRNATVQYAALRPWVRNVSGSGVTRLNVELLDTKGCPALTSDPSLPRYGDPIEWDQGTELIAAAHNVAGAQVTTPNLAAQVQSWLNGDCAGGVPGDGDHIGFRVDWDAGKALGWYTLDHTAPKPVDLLVAYTAPYSAPLHRPLMMMRGYGR
ncbi:MAG: hypothetical protein GF320_06155 [Armatimonadia bacterium]|nr:hypothetical protein [Armatimonadia bacterium]